MSKEIFVTRPSMPDFEEYADEIRGLWDSRILTNSGAKHKELQRRLEEYLGADHVDLLTNGHMALELSMQALGLEGEVVTTPFTFASTTQAIVRNGLRPVFCDVNPSDFTIDVSKIEDLITERTSAIVAVHVYGNICDVKAIDRIARRHHLKVVYDAAHAFGARFKGRGIASWGDVSCFSFHATKVFNTVEGGAVCFSDPVFGERIGRLKNFGIENSEAVSEIGANAKMNELCAAMGICNLRHVDSEIARRGAVVARYRRNLADAEGVSLIKPQTDVEQNHAYMPAVFDEEGFGSSRDEVFEALAANGIHARKYFYPLTSSFECYGGRFDPGTTPVALKVSRQVLALPLYADLPLEDVDRICGIILECRGRGTV